MRRRTNSGTPKISVIVPVYNQARYLAEAVESVLAQTCSDYEIIVVDDGSTDDTPAVARQYGECIRYIRQENRGLAGARNTGIRAAIGEYIGLLDSDDSWMPNFVDTMLAAAEKNPNSVALCCAAACMDQNGEDLRQIVGYRANVEKDLYQTLLRSNFIIPSTVCLLRSAVEHVGLFDEELRSCEDWDLWLRLLPDHSFTCLPDVLARYRIHTSSLTANTHQMQMSKRKVIEKLFGPEDNQIQDWSRDKRRVYGGYYRYEVLTSVLWAHDWQKAGALRQAILIDPSLASDISFFYDLSLGDQPKGYRGTTQQINLPANANCLNKMLAEAFDDHLEEALVSVRRQVYASAFKALAMAAYNTEHYAFSRKYAVQAARYDPNLCIDPLIAGNFIKSFLGKRGITFLRRQRNHKEKSSQ